MPLVARRRRDRLGRLEEREHPLDVVDPARVVEDAQAQRGPPVHASRGDEADLALLERGHETVRQLLLVLPVPRQPPEADDAEGGRCHELQPLALVDQPVRELGEIEAAVDRLAERVEPERRRESQSLNARVVRVSWRPRSAKLTSWLVTSASRR